jgi:hypothetical protein
MNVSTRSSQKRHRVAALIASSLVAVLIAVAPSSFASTALTESDAPKTLAPGTAPAAHDIAITTVKSGAEGLELSARFSEDGNQTVNDVEWIVEDQSGNKFFNGISSNASASLTPGDYLVTANYGAAHIVQGLTIHQGTKLTVSFVLNAGGLRVLPRLKDIGWPRMASQSKVFSLSGATRGQLVATSFTPGEVLKVLAGDYRIESRFASGNAKAVTDVHVRPGIMSAVNIDYVAGLAHLSVEGATTDSINWTVTDDNGLPLQATDGQTHDIILIPGNYTVEATSADLHLTANFKINSGQSISVLLSN